MKELAVIKNVGYGNRDMDTPCLFFEAIIVDGVASTQCLFGEKAEKFIKESGVYDIKHLEGKCCYVERDNGFMRLLGFAKI